MLTRQHIQPSSIFKRTKFSKKFCEYIDKLLTWISASYLCIFFSSAYLCLLIFQWLMTSVRFSLRIVQSPGHHKRALALVSFFWPYD